MRRIAVIAAVLIWWSGLPVVAQAPPATIDIAPATVVRVPSASLGREQVAAILLPASYGTSRQRYPVIYLLHGGGQDHTTFATRGWFRALASRDTIVVTPSVGDSWYVNSVADANAKYEDFVVKDLIEYVDGQYRTIASREGRAIAESVPLLYLACGNQDIFVADNRRFVERLTARRIPYEYRELSPFGHSWDVWDGQLVSFVDVISTRWGQGLARP
jgi:S-formylglutathione hydrolase FrmB